MLATFAEQGCSEYWGEATDVCLIQEVQDAARTAIVNDNVQKAFARDKQDWHDTQDAGGIQDNPWVLFDSHARKTALAQRMKVIAIQNGGTGNETCDPDPIGYVEAHQLAKAGREWLDKGYTAADVDMQPNSDDVFYMRLAMKYLVLENAAIAAGNFKTPDVVQREIAVAKFMAGEYKPHG